MKRIIYFTCFCALTSLFLKCKKEDNSPLSIVGSWELKQGSGSFTQNYDKGNGNILKFTASEYEIYKAGALTKKGTYALIADTTVQNNVCLVLPSAEYKNRIVYDNDYNATKAFIKISANQLYIISGCFATDGGSITIYEKQ